MGRTAASFVGSINLVRYTKKSLTSSGGTILAAEDTGALRQQFFIFWHSTHRL
jgi:hypothetical protein